MRVETGVVLEIVQDTGHVPTTQNICTSKSSRSARGPGAALGFSICGSCHLQSNLSLQHDQLLSTNDAHAFVWPLEVDVLVVEDGVIECLLEWVAAYAVDYGRDKPVEIEFSGNFEGGKGGIIERGYRTSFFASFPGRQSHRKR